MLRTLSLFSVLFFWFSAPVFAQETDGPDFRSTWVLEISAQICMVNDRDVCILKSATYALRNAELLNHMQEYYPEKIDWFQDRFEESSYKATIRGRSLFRRILAENAIEVLEIYFNDFQRQQDPSLTQQDLENRSAIFHLIRAQSCSDQDDDACAVKSLGVVKNVLESGAWGEISKRFDLEDQKVAAQKSELFAKYEAQL